MHYNYNWQIFCLKWKEKREVKETKNKEKIVIKKVDINPIIPH